MTARVETGQAGSFKTELTEAGCLHCLSLHRHSLRMILIYVQETRIWKHRLRVERASPSAQGLVQIWSCTLSVMLPFRKITSRPPTKTSSRRFYPELLQTLFSCSCLLPLTFHELFFKHNMIHLRTMKYQQ